MKHGRVTESEIGEAALEVLATRPAGIATVRDLKREIPQIVNLSPQDRTPSVTRRNEEIWEQQIRNLRSHHNVAGNILREGLARRIGKGTYQITDAGRLHLKSK